MPITNDQLASVDGLSDAAAAAQLSVPVTTQRLVPYPEFQSFMMTLSCYAKIGLANQNPNPAWSDELKGLIFVADKLLTNYAAANVDMSLQAFINALDGLVEATLLSTDERTAILALSEIVTYPCGALVGESDVASARAAKTKADVVFNLRDQLGVVYQRAQDRITAFLQAGDAATPTMTELLAE